MTNVSFSGIGTALQVNVNLRELSGRDQVNLCRWLMEELGIISALSSEPDATARAQELITECWNKAWK